MLRCPSGTIPPGPWYSNMSHGLSSWLLYVVIFLEPFRSLSYSLAVTGDSGRFQFGRGVGRCAR